MNDVAAGDQPVSQTAPVADGTQLGLSNEVAFRLKPVFFLLGSIVGPGLVTIIYCLPDGWLGQGPQGAGNLFSTLTMAGLITGLVGFSCLFAAFRKLPLLALGVGLLISVPLGVLLALVLLFGGMGFHG